MKVFAKFCYLLNGKLVDHIASDCYAQLDARLSIDRLVIEAQRYASKKKNIMKIDKIKIVRAIDFRQFINDQGNVISCIINK